MDKYVGRCLDDRYEIREIIGVGGMAIVYKAFDRKESKIVSVKIMRDEFEDNAEFMRRFRNESRAISMLSHPNIVNVFDVSLGDRVQYIVMEYIDGITLKEYIEQQKVVRWKEAVHFTLQILRALQHAHENGIVHRDIKPQNIMLMQDGTIKVTDFGIARFSHGQTRTLTDKAIGSVHYIAPEQARGSVTDAKTDLYSLGVMMYEMLTGKLPFEAENAVSVAIMQMQTEAKPPRELNPDIPEGLEQITMKAMKKESGQRYASAELMIEDINAFKQNPSIRFEYQYMADEKTLFIDTDLIKREAAAAAAAGAIDLDRQRRRNSIVPVLAGIVLALMVFAISFGVVAVLKVLAGDEGKEEIFLPDFVGMNYEDIEAQYGNLFDFELDYQPDDTLAEGIIKRQEPKGGVKNVLKGSSVKLVISSGIEYTTVPYGLVGSTMTDARTILRDFDLGCTVQEVYDEDTAVGSVVAVYPSEGDTISTTQKVILYVSRGKEDVTVTVDNYVGKTFEKAKNEILKLNLKVSEPIEVNSYKPKGQVIAQDPGPGSSLLEGESVILTISNGIPPEPVKVTISFNVILPTTATQALDLTVWVDGVQDTSKNVRVDPTLITSTPVKLTANEDTTASVIIRLNGKNYQMWTLDFSNGGSAICVRDYGWVEEPPVTSTPSSSNPDSSSSEPDSSSSNSGNTSSKPTSSNNGNSGNTSSKPASSNNGNSDNASSKPASSNNGNSGASSNKPVSSGTTSSETTAG